MIMASWSSVPGDATYGMKRAFESLALVLARPSYDAQASLNEQYTKRRLEEAKVLLSSHQSTEGLSYLSQQITATKAMIQNAPTQQKKQEAAKKYITTLQSVSTELKEQKKKSSGLALKTTTKSTTRSASSQGTSQQDLQAQLQKQIQQVQELQESLQSQLQNPQSELLLSQLQQQSQQLQQLQQQVQQGNQPSEAIQEQVAQQVQQAEAVQDQVLDETPSADASQNQVDDLISNTQDEVDSAIEELQNIAASSDNDSLNQSDTTQSPQQMIQNTIDRNDEESNRNNGGTLNAEQLEQIQNSIRNNRGNNEDD